MRTGTLRFPWLFLTAGLLSATVLAAQDKPAAPAVPFDQILACVQASNCKNMTKSSIWWFDMAGLPVLTFSDNGSGYALSTDGRWGGSFVLFLTAPAGRSAQVLMAFDGSGKLLRGEFGPQPGDAPQTGATPEQRATSIETWAQRHKRYRAGSEGEEFKAFWQERADLALAAIARALTRASEPQDKASASQVPFDQILACVQASNCKNMKPARMSTWSDVGPGMGLVFEDRGTKYELSVSGPPTKPSDLAIMTTASGETRPGELVTLDSTGKLVTASLARPPGEPAVFRGTPAELEASWKARKSFVAEPRWPRGGTLGEEFKPFWQERADLALAAIARVLSRPPEAQDKPAAPAVPFDQILACVQASNCKNMTASSMNWYDVIGIPVLTFKDDGWTYAVRSDALRGAPVRGVTIYVTAPGDSRPSRSLGLDTTGKLVHGELGPQPGDTIPSRDSYAVFLQKHKVFATADRHPSGQLVGEENKPFWQQLADQSLDAIRRQMSK